jgi:AraC family transcriptional regulator
MHATVRSKSDGLGEMGFSTRASSVGRAWSGFEAATYDVTGGIAERGPAAAHILIMHLSAPVPGSCRCGDTTSTRTMGPGNMDLVPLGCAATWLDEGPGSVLNVRMSGALLASAARELNSATTQDISVAPRLHLQDRQLEHLGWTLVAELESGKQGGRLFAECIGNAIAVHVARRYSSAQTADIIRGLSRRQFRSVVDYIGENLATDLSLSDIAAIAGLSPSYFNALFKRSAGVTLHQYVMRQRVDRAVRLLSRDGTRLPDVAVQAGFADQSHMSRCVRKLTGLTPTAFARGRS